MNQHPENIIQKAIITQLKQHQNKGDIIKISKLLHQNSTIKDYISEFKTNSCNNINILAMAIYDKLKDRLKNKDNAVAKGIFFFAAMAITIGLTVTINPFFGLLTICLMIAAYIELCKMPRYSVKIDNNEVELDLVIASLVQANPIKTLFDQLAKGNTTQINKLLQDAMQKCNPTQTSPNMLQ